MNTLVIKNLNICADGLTGIKEAIGAAFPKTEYQCCIVHFYKNVFTVIPKQKVKEAARMLKAIHAQEDKEAALQKAAAVVEKLRSMRLSKATQNVVGTKRGLFEFDDMFHNTIGVAIGYWIYWNL